MRCSTSVKRNKLKDAIIAELAASTNPSMAINPELIDLRLQQFLPTLQTPTHPPYSLVTINHFFFRSFFGCHLCRYHVVLNVEFCLYILILLNFVVEFARNPDRLMFSFIKLIEDY